MFRVLAVLAFMFSVGVAHADHVANSTGSAAQFRPDTAEQTARNSNCLAGDQIRQYSRSVQVWRLTQHKHKILSDDLSSVSEALERSHLLQHDDQVIEQSEEESAMDDDTAQADRKHSVREVPLPEHASQSDAWLKRNGFVNLMKCAGWKADHDEAWEDPKSWVQTQKRLHKARQPYLSVPKGAVVVYRDRQGGDGKIDVATPSGFWPSHRKSFYSGNLEVIGVYVKPDGTEPFQPLTTHTDTERGD